MTEVEKTNILAWMDKQIELDKDLEATEHCGEEISRCDGRYGHRVHISELEGMKKIAEAAGTELLWQKEMKFIDANFYIIYKDYKFFTLDPNRKSTEEQPCI